MKILIQLWGNVNSDLKETYNPRSHRAAIGTDFDSTSEDSLTEGQICDYSGE